MAVFEGWTFAAARGASRKTLFEIAEAAKLGPQQLEHIEKARDVVMARQGIEVVHIERLVEVYEALGFRILPRSLFGAACLKRVA